MGQRFQIIKKHPKTFWNKDNPNNKPESCIVYHNQWLYGTTAIDTLHNLVNGLKKLIEMRKENYLEYPIEYLKEIEKFIQWDNNKELGYEKGTHKYFPDGEDNKIENHYENIDNFLDCLDNNNGFIFILIDGKNNIKYSLVNGYEDDEERKDRTPTEYYDLFCEGHKFPENTSKQIYDLEKNWEQIPYKKFPIKFKGEKNAND